MIQSFPAKRVVFLSSCEILLSDKVMDYLVNQCSDEAYYALKYYSHKELEAYQDFGKDFLLLLGQYQTELGMTEFYEKLFQTLAKYLYIAVL